MSVPYWLVSQSNGPAGDYTLSRRWTIAKLATQIASGYLANFGARGVHVTNQKLAQASVEVAEAILVEVGLPKKDSDE